MEVVNNRLLFIGGGNLATGTSNRVFIHNEETGWHLSNMEIQVSRSRHVSSVISASDISQSYPGIVQSLVQISTRPEPTYSRICHFKFAQLRVLSSTNLHL